MLQRSERLARDACPSDHRLLGALSSAVPSPSNCGKSAKWIRTGTFHFRRKRIHGPHLRTIAGDVRLHFVQPDRASRQVLRSTPMAPGLVIAAPLNQTKRPGLLATPGSDRSWLIRSALVTPGHWHGSVLPLPPGGDGSEYRGRVRLTRMWAAHLRARVRPRLQSPRTCVGRSAAEIMHANARIIVPKPHVTGDYQKLYSSKSVFASPPHFRWLRLWREPFL